MAASIWNPAGTSANTANANNTYQAQKFTVAVNGQTLFSLTDFSYVPGTGSLLVEINGVDQYIGDDFLETNGVQVTFTSGLVIGDEVVIRGLVGITGPAGDAALAAMAAIQLLNVPALPLVLSAGGTGVSAASPNAAYNALSPNTAKGDITVYDGAKNVRLPVGVTNQKLVVDPSQAAGVKWVTSGIPKSSRAVNAQLVLMDGGSFINFTASFTQTFDTPANLGADWNVFAYNASSGNITLTGVTNNTIYPGEFCLIQNDGTALTKYILEAGTGQVLVVSDQKASGTVGGAATTGDITAIRTVNTVELNNIQGASLASNIITLPAGTYQVDIAAPFMNVGSVSLLLWNDTDSAYVLQSINNSTGASTVVLPRITGQFTITGTKNFKLRYFANSTSSTQDLGGTVATGRPEIYTRAMFKKVA